MIRTTKMLYGVNSKGLVHLGAHLAEERAKYLSVDWGPRLWVEALPDVYSQLKERLRGFDQDQTLQGVVTAEAGVTVDFYRIAENVSSSTYQLAENGHPFSSAETVEKLSLISITLKDVINYFEAVYGISPDVLVLDIQGGELDALRGGSSILSKFDCIISEISYREIYKGAPLAAELINFLNTLGFILVDEFLVSNTGHGDAVFLRKDQVPVLLPLRRIISQLLHTLSFLRFRITRAIRKRGLV